MPEAVRKRRYQEVRVHRPQRLGKQANRLRVSCAAMTLTVGSRVEVWERQRLCYVAVITAEDERHFAVKKEPSSITAVLFYRSDLKQCDDVRRYLRAVQS